MSRDNTPDRYGRNQQATKPKHVQSESIENTVVLSKRHPQGQTNRISLRAKLRANLTQLRLTIVAVLAVALILIALAFFSSNWLESERRYYGSKFKRLGLWRMCFNSFSAPDDTQFRKFYVGCRWVFADEYKPIRRFILPGSFRLHYSI